MEKEGPVVKYARVDRSYPHSHDDRKRPRDGRRRWNRTDDFKLRSGRFEKSPFAHLPGPCPSREGWTIFVKGIHPDATEDSIVDTFSDFGVVGNIQCIRSRNAENRTSNVGSALIQFEDRPTAAKAIQTMHGSTFYGVQLSVDWAFCS